jgi:hypothetical protein
MLWLFFIVCWILYFMLRDDKKKKPDYTYIDEIDVGYGGVHKHTRRVKND